MERIIEIRKEEIELRLRSLKESLSNDNDICDVTLYKDGVTADNLLVINLIYGNGYNCLLVNSNGSTLIDGHYDDLEFKSKFYIINSYKDMITKISESVLQLKFNLVDDDSGCDYEDEVYYFIANLVAKYYFEEIN
ncbi:MAG: hypothetical protein RR620_08950 [Clostridium sp.]